jgi:hypothetical protein
MNLCFGSIESKLIAYLYSGLAREIDGREPTLEFYYPFRESSGMAKQVAKVCGFKYNKAEFIAVTEASKDLLWMKRLACELGFEQEKYVLFYEKQSAIHLSKNGSFHPIPKHIEICYHWIRDVMNLNKFKWRRCT